MNQEEKQKFVGMFKAAISYEELNLVKAQNDCIRDWQKHFRAGPKRERGEEILNKLVVDSLNHALIFTNSIIKIYEEELRKFS